MRKYLALLILFVPGLSATAQQDSISSFYDKAWKKTDDASKAEYRRSSILVNGLWQTRDYYLKNGALQASGTYTLQDSIRNGDFVYYFENGQMEQEGKYTNDEREGVWNVWYENGSKRAIAEYRQGYKINKNKTWYENGSLRSDVNYLDDVAACRAAEKTDSAGQKIRIEGKCWGTCLYYYLNGKLASREEWKDKPVTIEYWDDMGNKTKPDIDSSGDYVFLIYPRFEGSVSKFISSEVRYPRKARDRWEQGRPIVKFAIGNMGAVTDVSLYESCGYPLLDEEAIRVVRLMEGKWTPGKEHNLPVKVYYNLPISFKLK